MFPIYKIFVICFVQKNTLYLSSSYCIQEILNGKNSCSLVLFMKTWLLQAFCYKYLFLSVSES